MVSEPHYCLANSLAYAEATVLWQSSERVDVFNHPEYWRALLESGVHCGKVVSIEVRTPNDQLLAIWPFIVKRGGAKDLFCLIAEPLGAHYADYICPVIVRSDDKKVLSCLIEGVAEVFNGCGRMRIPKLLSGEGYTDACVELGKLVGFSRRKDQSSPRLHFESNYEQTEKTLGWSKKHRPSVRIRRLRKDGDLVLWIAQSKGDIKERLQILFDMHKNKWNNQGKPSQFDHAEERECFSLFMEKIPQHLLHYSEVRLDEKVLSAHFGFLNNKWLYWYKPSYDFAFESISPGVIHIALLVEKGVEQEWLGIDFLQGDEAYKFRWANDARATVDLVLATKCKLIWWFWEIYVRDEVRKFFIAARNSVKFGWRRG